MSSSKEAAAIFASSSIATLSSSSSSSSSGSSSSSKILADNCVWAELLEGIYRNYALPPVNNTTSNKQHLDAKLSADHLESDLFAATKVEAFVNSDIASFLNNIEQVFLFLVQRQSHLPISTVANKLLKFLNVVSQLDHHWLPLAKHIDEAHKKIQESQGKTGMEMAVSNAQEIKNYSDIAKSLQRQLLSRIQWIIGAIKRSEPTATLNEMNKKLWHIMTILSADTNLLNQINQFLSIASKFTKNMCEANPTPYGEYCTRAPAWPHHPNILKLLEAQGLTSVAILTMPDRCMSREGMVVSALKPWHVPDVFTFSNHNGPSIITKSATGDMIENLFFSMMPPPAPAALGGSRLSLIPLLSKTLRIQFSYNNKVLNQQRACGFTICCGPKEIDPENAPFRFKVNLLPTFSTFKKPKKLESSIPTTSRALLMHTNKYWEEFKLGLDHQFPADISLASIVLRSENAESPLMYVRTKDNNVSRKEYSYFKVASAGTYQIKFLFENALPMMKYIHEEDWKINIQLVSTRKDRSKIMYDYYDFGGASEIEWVPDNESPPTQEELKKSASAEMLLLKNLYDQQSSSYSTTTTAAAATAAAAAAGMSTTTTTSSTAMNVDDEDSNNLGDNHERPR